MVKFGSLLDQAGAREDEGRPQEKRVVIAAEHLVNLSEQKVDRFIRDLYRAAEPELVGAGLFLERAGSWKTWLCSREFTGLQIYRLSGKYDNLVPIRNMKSL